MIDVHNALDVFLWFLLAGGVPALAVGLASLIVLGILLIPAAIADSEGLAVLAVALAFITNIAGAVIAFIHLPWWLSLFGYTDPYLVLMSYIVFVLGSSGLTLGFRASRS